ncbi:MAG: PIN domain-containing protein [Rhodothermales bacterium]|nr:PIN domain-containing protein [Rhodothermales bacterium]MBO6778444.1 PIN domain-containing protein [Rhodothermales bacterium]
MTGRTYLIDAGPLVAVMNRRDRHHQWATETLDHLDGGIATCESVLSEACFLAKRGGGAAEKLLDLLATLQVRLLPMPNAARDYLRKYQDIASVADATLLALADEDANRIVCTTDVRDFGVYRLSRRRRVPALMPPS